MDPVRPLGRIVQHDPRSRRFAFTPTVEPTTVKWERHAPVFDQGNLGSCTGNACLGALATGPIYDALYEVHTLPIYDEETAVDLYSLATTLDEWPGQYPPEDTGSSGLAVAKAAQQHGWLSGYTHAFSYEAALSALSSSPVITGVNWYSSFNEPFFNGECPVSMDAYIQGGHELVLDEINVESGQVWFTNSWGDGWGLAGRGWFSFPTFERLLAEQGDVTILVPATEPAPTPTPSPDEPKGCLWRMVHPLGN